MPATYDSIATTTGGTASFQNIPQTYTDLILVCQFGEIRFNNVSTGTLYSQTFINGNGTSATSSRINSVNIGYLNFLGVGAGVPYNIVHIFNYSSSSANKTYLSETFYDNNGSGFVSRTIGLFRSTSAITRIDLSNTYGNGPHSLYGILRA